MEATTLREPSWRGLVSADEGLVSARAFIDPEIYQLELERIFARSWLFVAHTSEVPRPGDFVTRWMGEDPVIVWRGADGRIRVLLNVCRHRGRRVCGEDLGRAPQFRCPYHGWTYNSLGELIAVPFFDAYQGKLDTHVLGLYQAPRVDSYQGLIFASWEAQGETLAEYLGPMKWVFDLLFGRTEAMEVAGPPLRWVVGSNWKLAAANFAGDGHHIFTTHGFRTALGLETIRGDRVSYVLPSANGHACTLSCWPRGVVDEPYFRLPRELWGELEQHLTPEHRELMKNLAIVVGNLFPNFSFLESASHTHEEWGADPDNSAVSFLTVRQWQPKGPDRMEVWSWMLLDKNAPRSWKETAKQLFYREMGMAGVFEQDDMENWADITATLRGTMARRLTLQYRMGLEMDEAQQWPGPGVAYVKHSFEEFNERVFYRHWHATLMGESSP